MAALKKFQMVVFDSCSDAECPMRPMLTFEDGSAFESNEAGDGNSRDKCPSIEKLRDRAVRLIPGKL